MNVSKPIPPSSLNFDIKVASALPPESKRAFANLLKSILSLNIRTRYVYQLTIPFFVFYV